MALETILIEDANGVQRAVSVDQIGSEFIQAVKVAFGADGVAATLASSANPLPTTDAGTLAAVDTLEAGLASILAKIIAAPATEAKQDTLVAAVDGLEALLAHGTYAYASGTSAGTVDVPAGARAKRVSVVASSAGTATITIAGGSTITVPAEGAFDEQLPGDATLGGDVVIGGNVASYYVAWTV